MVERQGGRRAVEAHGILAAQRYPARIADRGNGGKPVERAAQHEREEARVAAFGPRLLG